MIVDLSCPQSLPPYDGSLCNNCRHYKMMPFIEYTLFPGKSAAVFRLSERQRLFFILSSRVSNCQRKVYLSVYLAYRAAISCILRLISVRTCNGSRHSHLSSKLKRIAYWYSFSTKENKPHNTHHRLVRILHKFNHPRPCP